MDGLCQLPQSTWLDCSFSLLEVYDCAPGNTGLTRQQLVGKLLRFCPDEIQIFRVDDSFVLAAGFVRRVQCARVSHHGRIGAARPTRGCLFSDEMKITGDDVPTGKQAYRPARAYAAVGSSELTFGSRQDMIDFIFHRPEGRRHWLSIRGPPSASPRQQTPKSCQRRNHGLWG